MTVFSGGGDGKMVAGIRRKLVRITGHVKTVLRSVPEMG
jgi:hypothetical protein